MCGRTLTYFPNRFAVHNNETGAYKITETGSIGIKLQRKEKTDSQDNLAKRRHGQAIAMQYVVNLLQIITAGKNQKYLSGLLENVTSEGGGNVIYQTHLGCTWAINILVALTAEFALKALLIKKEVTPPHRHDLLELYALLPPDTRNQLEEKFRISIENGEVVGTESLCQLMALHKDDFVNWRYLDKEPEHLIPECRELQFAVHAILDVY